MARKKEKRKINMQNLYGVLGNYNSIEEKRAHLLELEKKYGDLSLGFL